VHVKELKLPKGVEAVLHKGENPVVATIIQPVLITEEEETAAAAVPAGEVPTTEQAALDKDAAAAGDKAGAKPGDKAAAKPAADKGGKPGADAADKKEKK
jgi:hypothetical protein